MTYGSPPCSGLDAACFGLLWVIVARGHLGALRNLRPLTLRPPGGISLACGHQSTQRLYPGRPDGAWVDG